MKDEISFVEVYEGTLFQSQMVVNLLENENIPAFLKDELIGSRNAIWAPSGGVRVIISKENAEAAKAIIKAYEQSQH